jgi:hypothetical protein
MTHLTPVPPPMDAADFKPTEAELWLAMDHIASGNFPSPALNVDHNALTKPFSAAVWLTLPAHVTTEEQAREYIAEKLQALDASQNPMTPIFADWYYVANYYDEEMTPRNDNNHPDFA